MDEDIKKGLKELGKSSAKLAKTATVGLLGATAGALGIIANATDRAVEAVGDGSERMYEKSLNDMLAKHPDNCHLWFNEIVDYSRKWKKSKYYFRDMSGIVICYAEGGYNNKLQHIKLYDSNNQLLGEIKEKRIYLHNPVDPYPFCFEVKVLGEKSGEIRKLSGLKNILYMTSTEWRLVHVKVGKKSIIDNNDNNICEISSSLLWTGDFIDYSEYDKGIEILLMIIANRAREKSETHKTEKRTFHSDGY